MGYYDKAINGISVTAESLSTAQEALRRGFNVSVLTDAVAGVDVVPGASAAAIQDMLNAGAQLATVSELQA